MISLEQVGFASLSSDDWLTTIRNCENIFYAILKKKTILANEFLLHRYVKSVEGKIFY